MEESKEQIDQPPPTSVTVHGDVEDIDYNWLEVRTLEVLGCLCKQKCDLSILVVQDEEMSDLHLKHSGIAGTTDVLTFDHGSDGEFISADLAICFDVAVRESETRNHPVQNELLLYIVHGILHCIGFDDHNDEDHKLMHQEEDRILKAIGVGVVWNHST
jgi:probable rRNA maturation factor